MAPDRAKAELSGIIEDLTKAYQGAGGENPHVRNAIDATRRLAEVVQEFVDGKRQ